MSDYLRNVAARVLFPERNLRPRVPSIFEPWGESAPLPLDPTPPGAFLEPRAEASPPARKVPSRSEPSIPRAAEELAPPAPVAHGESGEKGPPLPTGSPLSQVVRGDAFHEPREATPASEDPRVSVLVPASPARGHAAPLASQPTPPFEESDASAPAPVGKARPAAPRAAFPALSSPQPELVTPQLPRWTGESVVEPSLRSPLRASIAPVAQAVAPDVHVTIGRVEVRATQTPAVERRQHVASRAMTLAEYLRRRDRTR